MNSQCSINLLTTGCHYKLCSSTATPVAEVVGLPPRFIAALSSAFSLLPSRLVLLSRDEISGYSFGSGVGKDIKKSSCGMIVTRPISLFFFLTGHSVGMTGQHLFPSHLVILDYRFTDY